MALDLINTSRLTLRSPRANDASAIARALNDWEVARWLSRVPYPYQELDATKFIEGCRVARSDGTAFRFVIDRENELVGGIGLENQGQSLFELGYWIARENWGKGIATEAVFAIINFAFEELGASRIVASCHQQNRSSEKVLLTTNFSRVGVGLKFSRVLGKQVSTILFCLDQAG